MGRVILSWDELAAELNRVRQSKKVVFTNGCFDILHVGHVRYLQEARAQGDFLVVALNSDSSVRALNKGPERPINSELARAEVMAALGCVDFVTIFSEPTPLEVIQHLAPDVLVKGGDWKVEQIVGSEFVLARGGEVKSLRFVDGFSTTSIVQKIQK